MFYMRKFLLCFSLQIGCMFLGYFSLVVNFGFLIMVIVVFKELCKRMIWIWFLHCQVNTIAAVLLLSVAFHPLTLNHLLPIQIVVRLTSVIIELIFYLLMPSGDSMVYKIVVGYSFVSLISSMYVVIVTFSFYQETEHKY